MASEAPNSRQHSKTAYHYTDKRGLEGIMSAGRIKQSTDEVYDARMGKGVYLNDLPPHQYTKAQIAQNNYDGLSARGLEQRAEYAIEVRVPENKVDYSGSTNRSVIRHHGDIVLDNSTVVHKLYK